MIFISSSDVNPTVIYQTPGVYTVSLLAQNSKGTNTIKKDNYRQTTIMLLSTLFLGILIS